MRDRKAEFDELGAVVLLISFVGGRAAGAWLAETGAPFTLLIDERRSVYRAYGLRSSILSVWNLRVLWAYIRLIARGRKLRPIQGDPNQLGGDFLVDSDGFLCLAWPSRDPTDRPPVETLLQAIRDAPQSATDERQPLDGHL